ncbi:urease accessory protein UreE [Sporolactobacillus sp. Y61]|uniref:Urease accessory protein UreE n=1 Tax=Sporolactobacillus sp. Y61 TaxID=3160863 RepID=A0AAU8IFV0_9BACL
MIIEKIKGNINTILPEKQKAFHIEKVFLESSDLLKRIQRVKTDHEREIGIRLSAHTELHTGDILYQKDNQLIIVDVLPEEVLAIHPGSIQEMGKIAYQLGNRHLPVQFEGNEMLVQYDYLVEDLLNELSIPYIRQKRKVHTAFRHIGHHHE